MKAKVRAYHRSDKDPGKNQQKFDRIKLIDKTKPTDNKTSDKNSMPVNSTMTNTSKSSNSSTKTNKSSDPSSEYNRVVNSPLTSSSKYFTFTKENTLMILNSMT